jgi:hypothetical protein
MDKTKAMWQLTNKEIGKVPGNYLRLELRTGNRKEYYYQHYKTKFILYK